MRPILFTYRGKAIRSYTAMLYVGAVAAIVAGNLAAHAAGLDSFRVFVADLVLLIPALLGARLFYRLFHWRRYRQDPRAFRGRTGGGATQYGAFAAAFPVSVPLLAALQLPLGAFWDIATFSILVGLFFVRIGCYLNGCCAGRASPSRFTLVLPNSTGVWERRIPAQLLEAAWSAALLLLAIAFWRFMPFPGALFLLTTAAYACGRLLLLFVREPHPGATGFTIQRSISVTLILFSLAVVTAYWPK
jgi:phosphatidylglycerol:prolipoprotein diacylglycerol transferase